MTQLYFAWENGPEGAMIAVVIGLAAGFLLGLRFKVFVLVPAILVAVTLIGMGGISWSIAGQMFLTSAAIQVGYVFGLVVGQVAIWCVSVVGAYLERRSSERATPNLGQG
jgi:hypothetical protein